MELGQWVLVLAEVVTAREYQDIFHGKSGEKVYYTQGRYKKRLFDEDCWEVIHRPMDPAPMSGENVCLMRRTFGMPRSMMVIGRTWRATGQYVEGSGGNDDYRPPYLQVDKRHPVLLLRDRLRWQTPLMALERDVVELPDRIAQLEEQVAHLEYKLPDRIAQLEEQVAHLEYELRWSE
jgi:hypothetical protein